MSQEIFKESTVEYFMGGDFTLPHCKTVGELRQFFREVDKELDGWGDDTEIAEIWLNRDQKIHVTLSKGICQ